MYKRGKKDHTRRNSPVVTYKFIDDTHRDLYDAGKITFEQATCRVEPEPFLDMVTQYQVKQLKKLHPFYLYPEQIRPYAKSFIFVCEQTGSVSIYRYLYTSVLENLASTSHGTLYITNKVLGE